MTLLLPRPARTVADEIAGGLAGGRGLRLVNYHSTPRRRAAEYARQIAALAQDHVPFRREDLDAWTGGAIATGARPPLMPVLFEGFRDNAEVLLPLLEAAGFTGWFVLPSHFPNVPAAGQRAFAAAHRLHYDIDDYPGKRIVMTWAEMRAIADRGHVFACHSRTHAALTPDTPDAVLHDQIVTAKQEMQDGLGREVDIFCWLHGAETGLNPRADALLRAAGYRYLLSNFRLQRLQ